MQETIDLDLKEIVQALVKRWHVILVSAVAGFVLLYVISAYVIAPKYTSSISLYVYNATDYQGGTSVNVSDLNASQRLVSTYIVILQDDEVLGQVGRILMDEFDAYQLNEWLLLDETDSGLNVEGLRKAINMSAINNTEILKIEVESENAELSARICTVMSEVAPEVLIRVVKAGSVEVIGTAKISDFPSSPNVRNYSLAGAFACIALSSIVVLLIYFLDTTVKDEEGLKKRFNIPVLGEIPDFSAPRKGGYYRYGA